MCECESESVGDNAKEEWRKIGMIHGGPDRES